jgi:hypothetical protein
MLLLNVYWILLVFDIASYVLTRHMMDWDVLGGFFQEAYGDCVSFVNDKWLIYS